ncbi:hypothetical protein ASE11_02390 [Hydrogenophaga sp. Root209]|uniref:hypothetical protein n=1 Tax=Hydrogenophaga sp. Root209 TaxID=1736490 RepID=UPI0006F8BF3F|nr:hypothetical protein [Hydrogenophaga sp. Root209]KRC12325.1 hypothetical protein ASE11_02390 [Hydrogenophaga sp. Root209]
MNASRDGVVLKSLAVTAVIFGVLTVLSGGRALFGGEEAARAAGAIVSFVLWFNFAAGFAYVVCGLGLWQRKRWAAQLAVAIAATTALVFAAFGVHVLTGGAYEARTVAAMTLRTLVWGGVAWAAWRMIRHHRSDSRLSHSR